jgi:hypothetical protein
MANLKAAAGLIAVLAACGWLAGAPARAESIMKECGAEWKQQKADGKLNGQTWQEFLKDCKTRHASAGSAAAPAPTPSPAATMAPAPAPTTAAAPKGAGQFASEGEAKGHCPTDTVVWVNLKSHKYHFVGNRSYGTTKRGAYMCESEAKSAGDVAAKGEKPKS